METVKKKIDQTINDYVLFFPEEWRSFKSSMTFKQNDLKNKFAEIKGTDLLERKLADMPGQLFEMLFNTLDQDEWAYFNSPKGWYWFIRRYKQFRSPEKI